jgi:hypothetical protein
MKVGYSGFERAVGWSSYKGIVQNVQLSALWCQRMTSLGTNFDAEITNCT